MDSLAKTAILPSVLSQVLVACAVNAIALSRNTCMFAGSNAAGQRSATFNSFVATGLQRLRLVGPRLAVTHTLSDAPKVERHDARHPLTRHADAPITVPFRLRGLHRGGRVVYRSVPDWRVRWRVGWGPSNVGDMLVLGGWRRVDTGTMR